MVRHAAREHGVRALGVTLSLEQAQWAKEAIDREGLSDLAEVRHLDYRDVLDGDFDAVSSIGLTEHVGVRNYPAYFAFLRDRLRPGGRLLNHCITRSHNHPTDTGARSEEHTSELQSLMRISYAVFCLKKKKKQQNI